MRSTFFFAGLALVFCAGCGRPAPTNPFPGNHAVRVINVSDFDCDVSVGKRLPKRTIPAKDVLQRIPSGGSGVLRLAPAEYEVSAECGPSHYPGSLRTGLTSGGTTDVVIVRNYPRGQKAAWMPEHGGASLQFGLYRFTPEAPAAGGLGPCEAECGDRFGECRAKEAVNSKSEHCINARNACEDTCHRQ